MIVTASTPAPRNAEPQRVRRARGRSGGQRYRSTKRSKRKNSGTDRAKGGDGGNTIAHLEEELAD